MTVPSIAQLQNGPPSVDLLTAAAVLRIGRTKAYELARRGEFPVKVIRIGGSWRVPVAGLLELLGIGQDPPPAADPRTSARLYIETNGHLMHALRPFTTSGAIVPDPVHGRDDLLVWGAHGGAGTSTLATLLRPARDMGTMRTEAEHRYLPLNPGGSAVLLACRCTTWSAIKAADLRPGGPASPRRKCGRYRPWTDRAGPPPTAHALLAAHDQDPLPCQILVPGRHLSSGT